MSCCGGERRRLFRVADGAVAGWAVFGGGLRQVGVAGAAEGVEGRFR